MAETALISAVKTALRVSSSAYDDEIEGIIDAAVVDLMLSGVSAAAAGAADPAPLIKRAIIVYAQAQFGLDNPDSEKYMESFRSLETHLALSAEYQQAATTGITGDIEAGSDELTVDDVTAISEDAWLSVAGAGADDALLIAQATAIEDSVVTLSRLAATTVTDAAVTVL